MSHLLIRFGAYPGKNPDPCPVSQQIQYIQCPTRYKILAYFFRHDKAGHGQCAQIYIVSMYPPELEGGIGSEGEQTEKKAMSDLVAAGQHLGRYKKDTVLPDICRV